jgi:predicted DNA-binding WGR domain protein
MSKGKKPPERSKIERAKPLAYQRRASDDARVVSEDNKHIEVEAKAAGDEVKTEERATGEMPAVVPPEADAPKLPEAKASDGAATAPVEGTPDGKAKPEAKSDAKPQAKAGPDAKPEPKAEKAKPEKTAKEANEDPTRASRETSVMAVAVELGAPPEVPGDVENPTHMPGPEDVPTSGSPDDAAKPPGHVPSGDSRSLRRSAEFALIYRQGTAVITRFGTVGQRGQWRVVEYPTPSSASNAYAKQCSQFVGEGFSDYRD